MTLPPDGSGPDSILSTLLALAAGEALVALLLAAVLRSRERAATGELLAREGTRPRARLAAVLACAAAAAALPALSAEWRVAAAALLGVSVLLALVAPWPGERRLGRRGVSVDGVARRFEALEEWRLAGRHLRVRLGGEWAAVQVGSDAEREELRERLAVAAPGRESPYRG